ncbi:MAG TPA: alpha/beta hydrolase fold domain-containing protein [Planctomycetaceae bacterium]|nr:alpha/beta hydrolase fold domain-containing protein [Planctomycetaceae bacterium]
MKRDLITLSVMVLILSAEPTSYAAEPALPELTTDIEFAKAGDVSLTLDAFMPDGAGPFPTCILVHGGGFTKGDKQSYIKPLFEPLSKAGFTWFTINYRLAPQHRWPACAEDVETAIRWVKSHAKNFKVDVARIALIGESAGGHLVSYVGVRTKDDTRVAAVVPFYAPHDLEFQVRHRNALGESMTALLDLTELNDDAWKRLREVSAISYVHKGMTPYLLIHGNKDQTVPYEQSLRFQKQMQEMGNQCDLITIPDGTHGMGGWDKLNSDYKDELIAWLKTTLNFTDAAPIAARLTELGAQVTHTDGDVTKVFFKDCSKLGDAEFRLIGQLKGLKSLTLYGQCKGLTDETLPNLASLTKLEELGTDGIQISDAGLAKLTALTNLRSLSFFHPSFGMKGFNGSGFAALKVLPKLERLTIAGTPFDDKGMAAIAEIKQLREFRTWHTYQTQAGNEFLTKLPELQSLWLGQRLRRYDGGSNAASLDDSTFDVLTKLKTLESLTLDEARLSLAALRRLKELPRLKKLALGRIDISAVDVEILKTALPSVAVECMPLTADERSKLEAFLKN